MVLWHIRMHACLGGGSIGQGGTYSTDMFSAIQPCTILLHAEINKKQPIIDIRTNHAYV